MQVQFIITRGEWNVVLEIAAPEVPVNIRVERPKNSCGRTDDHIAAGIESIGSPFLPAAVRVGIRGARDHSKALRYRRACWKHAGNGHGFGNDRRWLHRLRPPGEKGANEH